jgi:hypothetical protein
MLSHLNSKKKSPYKHFSVGVSPTWKSEGHLRTYEIVLLSNSFLSESEGTRHDMKSTWHQSSTEAVGLGYCWRRFVARTSVAPSAARACLNIFVRSSRRRDLLTLLARNFSLPDEYLPSFLPHLSPSVIQTCIFNDILFRGQWKLLRSTHRDDRITVSAIFRHRH